MGSLTELDKDSGIASDCSSLMSLQEEDSGDGSSTKSKSVSEDIENHNTISNTELIQQLANAEQRLDESLKDNKALNRKYMQEFDKISKTLLQVFQEYLQVTERHEAVKSDLDKSKVELHKERSLLRKYGNDIGMLRDQITSLGIRPCVQEVKLPPSSVESDSWHTGKKFAVQITEDDVLLACTLCFKKLRVDELEHHAKQCSASIPTPTTPTLPDVLLATVTVVDPTMDGIDCVFKVTTNTTIPSFGERHFEVARSATEFVWFRGALQDSCAEAIVPPLVLRRNTNDNSRELQRFLARVCSHKTLKFNELLQKFLSSPNQDFDIVQQSTERRRMVRRQSTLTRRTSRDKKDEDSLLCRAQCYVNRLEDILSNLLNILRATPKNYGNDALSDCFKDLADFEQNQTYLKVASDSLSRVTNLFNKSNHQDEDTITKDLDSLIDYIRTARSLLIRVESVVDTYLYWEEELKVYEEIKADTKIAKDGEGEVTQKWAEASAHYSAAKVELESVCKVLSSELIEFDYRKEQELRQIFMDYAESRSEYFEKLQSKWYGVKLMLELDISRDNRAMDFS